MKKIILTICIVLYTSTLFAQKLHTAKVGAIYEYYSFFSRASSYGVAMSYNYQIQPRFSINTRLGWTTGVYQPYIVGYRNLEQNYNLKNTETTKFLEFTLKYRIYPNFIPKNKIELGLGATMMSLNYNYIEESLTKGVYLFYLRKNTLNLTPILYHAMFQDKFQLNDKWSIYTNVVFRVTQKPVPSYYVTSKSVQSGHTSESYGSYAAHNAGNFVFALGLGYSF